MDFRLLNNDERTRLIRSLRGNAEDGKPIYMGRDTSVLEPGEEIPIAEVIDAVKSVPCHY